MKILAIIGSSKHGNTTDIIKYMDRKLNELEEVDFQYLYLSDYKIKFCTGCHNCIFEGEEKCSESTVIKEIEDKIQEADGLILASPGYMFSVTGIMKNFLDHVAYNCHRPKYFGKKVFILSSCTKWQVDGVFIPMETWAKAAGFTFVGKMYVDMLPLPYNEKELNKRRHKIELGARNFYKALTNNAERKVVFGDLMIFHSFRALSKMFPEVLKADYKYFQEKKAYDKESRWYVKAKVSIAHHSAANLIEGKMKKIIGKLVDIEKAKDVDGRYINRL